jgi:hypothetical protein
MNPYDIFESIDIIIDARLRELNLDRTIICTIKDNSERLAGKYTVSYNTATFFAYCADTTLNINDLVYVGVPESNYSNAYIITKKLQTENQKEKINPFSDYAQFVVLPATDAKIHLSKENTVENDSF